MRDVGHRCMTDDTPVMTDGTALFGLVEPIQT